MNGNVLSICISDRKGIPKTEAPDAQLLVDHGIEGDAHAGPWHRQVSLLDSRDIETMRAKGLDLAPGAFGENLVVAGVELALLGLGSRLRVGAAAELSITQIGKTCHDHCAIYEQTGDCIMPRLGLFARVFEPGLVRPGDAVTVLEVVPRAQLQAVVITVSDRCSRGETQDGTGPAVAKMLSDSAGMHVYKVEVVPDDVETISGRLEHYCDGHSIDLVVTAGGTGLSPRDVTPEATRSVLERLAPGLDEAMRAASLPKTPHAMLSRGVSGTRGSTLVVNLPGSVAGATENLDVILPALAHGLEKLRGDLSDCGR